MNHSPEQGASRLKLDNGPELIIPFRDREEGTRVLVEVRADDILLGRQPIDGLSARNQVPGTVERIIPHGTDAEVVVRTGGLTWIVSLVAPAVEQLGLEPGSTIQMIVKARSCHVIDAGESGVQWRNPTSPDETFSLIVNKGHDGRDAGIID